MSNSTRAGNSSGEAPAAVKDDVHVNPIGRHELETTRYARDLIGQHRGHGSAEPVGDAAAELLAVSYEQMQVNVTPVVCRIPHEGASHPRRQDFRVSLRSGEKGGKRFSQPRRDPLLSTL